MQLSEIDFKLSASAVVVELPLAEGDAWAYVEASFAFWRAGRGR